MRDRFLYDRILGIETPWQVEGVELHQAEGEVVVHVVIPLMRSLCAPILFFAKVKVFTWKKMKKSI